MIGGQSVYPSRGRILTNTPHESYENDMSKSLKQSLINKPPMPPLASGSMIGQSPVDMSVYPKIDSTPQPQLEKVPSLYPKQMNMID